MQSIHSGVIVCAMALRVTFALCALLGSAMAARAQPLEGLISFDDPFRCTPSADFDALLNGVMRFEKAGDSYRGVLAEPPIPEAVRPQIGKPTLTRAGNEYRAFLPLRGSWHGLRLTSLVVVQQVESEGGFYLVFDATPGQVRHAANRAGFRIPAGGGEYRDDPESVMGVNVGVADHGKGVLYCFEG